MEGIKQAQSMTFQFEMCLMDFHGLVRQQQQTPGMAFTKCEPIEQLTALPANSPHTLHATLLPLLYHTNTSAPP